MNKMWVRLSLMFGVVILVAFATTALVTVTLFRANTAANEAENDTSQATLLATALAEYFKTSGSWEGVSTVFEAGIPASQPPPQANFFVLTDTEGNVLAGAFSSGQDYNDPVPIVVNNETQGYLSTAVRPDRPFVPLWGLLRDTGPEQLLVLNAIILGAVSLLFGIMLSRWLTRPLDALAETAQQVGAGDLDKRVQLSGTAETQLLAESFNTMVDELQHVEKLRRDLVADVAHELRTPVSALQANLYAILDDALPMTKAEIASLYEQTRLLSRLIDDLHELTLAEARKLPMNMAQVDLAGALEDFVSPFRMVAETKDITVTLSVPPKLPPVRADLQRLNQIMHNLLGNALRHTPENGTIAVTASHNADAVRVTVQDSGDGISAEHLPYVFERFYRGDASRSRDTGGTGLGLAIVQAIAASHGGAVTVASEGVPGKGASFTLTLPRADKAKPDAPASAASAAAKPAAPVPSQ